MLIEDDVHDADALEFGDFVAKVIAHSPDLPVESLGQNNIEFVSIDLPNFTFIGDGVQDRNPIRHFMDKSFGNGFVHRHHIFLFMFVFGAEDFVNNITVAGKQDKSFTFLVQPAYRKNPLWMVDIIDDVVFLGFDIRCTDDADWFVECNVNMFSSTLH